MVRYTKDGVIGGQRNLELPGVTFRRVEVGGGVCFWMGADWWVDWLFGGSEEGWCFRGQEMWSRRLGVAGVHLLLGGGG